MAVFIANFGRGNYAWERCKRQSTIATMNDADLHNFWLSGDREGYIKNCIIKRKTANGDVVPKQLASRWFNLMTIISESHNDIWIHKDGNEIWWTETTDQAPDIDHEPRVVPYQSTKVFECHKPCKTWTNRSRLGEILIWDSLHPKAKDFLATESTLQKLSTENAAYVDALIGDAKLDRWHNLATWQESSILAKTKPVLIYNSVKRSIADMAWQAEQTAKVSNGQIVERALKNKEFRFKDRIELERLLENLLEAQENCCAISGMPLQFIGSHDDEQMLCSLDRINSAGHYERDNLQIVCRFINFWKNNMDDAEFRRLLSKINAFHRPLNA